MLLPEIEEQMSPRLKNALAVRNEASVSGRCRCGASRVIHGPLLPGRVTNAVFEHTDTCDASDAAIQEILREESSAR